MAVNIFQPFETPGEDVTFPALLQKGSEHTLPKKKYILRHGVWLRLRIYWYFSVKQASIGYLRVTAESKVRTKY